MGVAYVRIRDLLIIAPEPLGHLEDMVDVYQHQARIPCRRTPHLILCAGMRTRRERVRSSLILISFRDLWRGDMDSRLTSLGYQTAAFPVYGLSYLPGVVSKYKMMVGLDEKYMPGGMRKTFSCPALANDTLKLVPVDANCL